MCPLVCSFTYMAPPLGQALCSNGQELQPPGGVAGSLRADVWVLCGQSAKGQRGEV